MRESYNLRSGIVHGEGERKFVIDGKNYSHEEIADILDNLTRDAIQRVLNLIIVYGKQKHLLKELDLSLFNRVRLMKLLKQCQGKFSI